MSDSFGEAISYHTGVHSTDQLSILSSHCSSLRTSSNWKIQRQHIMDLSQKTASTKTYWKGKERIIFLDSESLSDRTKVTDCRTPKDS